MKLELSQHVLQERNVTLVSHKSIPNEVGDFDHFVAALLEIVMLLKQISRSQRRQHHSLCNDVWGTSSKNFFISRMQHYVLLDTLFCEQVLPQ